MKPLKRGAEALLDERGGTTVLTFPRLADPKVLRQAVSTRLGGVSRGPQGSLNISFKVGDETLRVEENRLLLSRAAGMQLNRAVGIDQVHGDRVLKLDATNLPAGGGSLGAADAIITNEKNIPLQILVADCLPVLFYDPVHKAVGLAHAGWRGTVGHVAAKALLAMGEAYGTKAEETRAVLGPCIGPCCYEVGKDVKVEFEQVFPWAGDVFHATRRGHWKLDLAEANARQLREMGMREENLIPSGLCTVEHLDLFYSHRAEASPQRPSGRMGVFLMLLD